MRALGAAPTSGTDPAAAEMATEILSLNMMLESFSIENLLVLGSYGEALTMTAGTLGYTIGAGGMFDTIRPVALNPGTFIRLDNIDYGLTIISQEVFSAKSNKAFQGRPVEVAYNPNRVFPLGFLTFYPTPDLDYTLVLNSLKPLTQVTALADVLSLPEGYAELFKYGLAKRLMTDFPCAPDTATLILNGERELMAKMKRYNQRQPTPTILEDESALSSRGVAGGIFWMQTGGNG